jgi:dimethylaniline monooxygenase (N-oxide forming)
LVPFKWATYSRFGHFTLPAYHDMPTLSRCIHGVAAPLKWVWWRAVEMLFTCQFHLPRDQRPRSRIEHDLFNGGQILSYEFREMRRRGQVDYASGSVVRFTEGGVVLGDGGELPADLVVYATGFTKSYDIFDAAARPRLGIEPDGLWLYRNMIPPGVPNLAFVGSEVSTFNNILTHGLQALWLARHLDGELALPTDEAMRASIGRDMAWKRSWMPPSSSRASIFQLHMLAYHDVLMRDMGENPKRKGWNKLCEVFAPYCARDYSGLFRLKEKQM